MVISVSTQYAKFRGQSIEVGCLANNTIRCMIDKRPQPVYLEYDITNGVMYLIQVNGSSGNRIRPATKADLSVGLSRQSQIQKTFDATGSYEDSAFQESGCDSSVLIRGAAWFNGHGVKLNNQNAVDHVVKAFLDEQINVKSLIQELQKAVPTVVWDKIVLMRWNTGGWSFAQGAILADVLYNALGTAVGPSP